MSTATQLVFREIRRNRCRLLALDSILLISPRGGLVSIPYSLGVESLIALGLNS